MSESSTPQHPLSSLAAGQALTGTVTRVELYGAFIDVGAETPGLVHISRLSARKVKRVEDVVNLGQQVEVWVVTADPNGNRLELTMVPPLRLRWKDLQPGMQVTGKVVKLERYGAFVDIGAERAGMIHVSEMSDGYVSNPSEILHPGDEVSARVVEVDQQKRQIRLTLKQPMVEEIAEEEDEPEAVATSMEAAFRRAMESPSAPAPQPEAGPHPVAKKSRGEQEDILARTLKHRVQ